MGEDGVALFAKQSGSGTPVVLIHGFPFDHTLWDDVVERMRGRAHLILPDLRGFGKSALAQDGPSGMGQMANDIAALLDRLKIPKAILAGHSMGGYVSLAFARAYPERLAGLALVTSQAAADTAERSQGRFQLAEQVGQRGVLAVVEANLERYSPDPVVRERAKQLMLTCQPAGVMAALRGMAVRTDMTELLAQLRVACVIVAGSADAIVPPEKAREMAISLQKGWVVEVPGGGHLPMYEVPDLVAQALLDLVERMDA